MKFIHLGLVVPKLFFEGLEIKIVGITELLERSQIHVGATDVPFWSTGTDSFLSDPPNADVTILEGNVLRQVVVVLQDPVVAGTTLSYTVRILDGDMPERVFEKGCPRYNLLPSGRKNAGF